MGAVKRMAFQEVTEQTRISDFESCWLEIRCCNGRSCRYPLRLMLSRHGDRFLLGAVRHLICENCQQTPQSVTLLERGDESDYVGTSKGWSIKLL